MKLNMDGIVRSSKEFEKNDLALVKMQLLKIEKKEIVLC